MPKKLTAYSGIDALVHAIEAIVSVAATDYTNALALEAARILHKYLPSAYTNGANDAKAREKVHNAATLAGMSFANAFLGLCHSIRDAGVDEKQFFATLDRLSEEAFDDQCTGTNPRYPLISEIKQLYANAYYGDCKAV